MDILELDDGFICLDNIVSAVITLTHKHDGSEHKLSWIKDFDITAKYDNVLFNLKINNCIILQDKDHNKVIELYDKILLKLKLKNVLD